jgi:cytochrome c553
MWFPSGDGTGTQCRWLCSQIISNVRGWIARRGISERDVAACDSCHGEAAWPEYPRLAGQHRNYIVNQLKLFTTLGPNRGGPFARIMAKAARSLAPEEIEAVADWYGH